MLSSVMEIGIKALLHVHAKVTHDYTATSSWHTALEIIFNFSFPSMHHNYSM